MPVSLMIDGTPTLSVYSAENPLRRPRQFVSSAWDDLVRSRTLAWEMFKRDVRGRYRQSHLGPVLVLTPAFMVTLWAVAFRSANIFRVDSIDVPYPLFVAIGAVLWTTFVEAIEAPIAGIAAEKAILSRSTAPVEAVLLAKLGQVLMNFGVKVAVVAALFVSYRRLPPPTILLSLLAGVALTGLGAGLGLLLAPLNLLYRDVSRLLWIATSVWFFLTPVFFPLPAAGALRLLILLNPVSILLTSAREWATGTVVSNPLTFTLLVGFAIPFLATGWMVLRASLPIVIEHAGE